MKTICKYLPAILLVPALCFAATGTATLTVQVVDPTGITLQGADISPSVSVVMQGPGRVSIAYSLPASANVKVSIHDASGKLVKAICSAVQTAGVHGLVWDGTDGQDAPVKAGLYFLFFSTGANTQIHRIVFLK